ncbi:hypothetical protein Pfo_004020 [Paulownia fortunei]|nr:hypothetical protein Pfo_004020 [Paulownia fortunei]
MAGEANQAETAYEEFEPLCKWHRNEDRDILEVHLQEFKKEQLKVQISNHGILKISGERPLGASTTSTKFYKEVPVPSYKYDAQAIHAKFVNGCLCITMPKRKTLVPEIDEKTLSKIDRTPKPEPPKISPQAHRHRKTSVVEPRSKGRPLAEMDQQNMSSRAGNARRPA